MGVYFINVYFLLHSTKLSILNGSAPTESVFLTASSMRWNDLEVKNCMGRKQNGQHLHGWLFSIFRALFKAMIMFCKIIAFSATTWEPWSQIIKYLSSWGQNQVTVLQKFIVIKMFLFLFFLIVILLDPWFVNGQKRLFRWMRVALLKLFFLEPKYAL